jgi:hypothetical protein
MINADLEETARSLSMINPMHTFVITVNPTNNHEGLVGVQMTPRQMFDKGYFAKRPPLTAYHSGSEVPYSNWAHYGV